jgi:hypothetical protein
MKRIVCGLLLLALFAAGCSTRYDIKLNNGGTIVAYGKPRYNRELDGYVYKDEMGSNYLVGAFKVAVIQPSSFRADKPKGPYLERQ